MPQAKGLMKKGIRGLRRHYAQKFKLKCQTFIRYHYFNSEILANDPKFVGKLAKTRKPCSCFMCGNPRKYFNEKTINEIRQW